MIKLSDVRSNCSSVFSSYDELPVEFKQATYEEAGKTRNRNDLVTPFRNGKEWTYEFTSSWQSRTGKALLEGGEFQFVVQKMPEGTNIYLVQEINGQVIEIGRQFSGHNPDDPEYPSTIERINANLTKNWGYPKKTTERHLSLPEPIRMAYYNRIDGLNIPDSPVVGGFARILPYPISRPWESIDRMMDGTRLKKQYLPLIEEMIPDVRPERKNAPYTNFMMFLNSWGSFESKKKTEMDCLFVKNHIQDGVVYYIRDMDVPNMTIIADPAEAIDRYCEHVLMRNEERFDFRPWAVPFESPSV
jgi:hypothetical protein